MKKDIIRTLLLIYFVFLVFFHIYNFFYGNEFSHNFVRIFFLVAPIIALFSSIYTANVYGFKSSRGKVFTYFSVAAMFFLLAEFVWLMFDVAYSVEIFPSVADVFFVLAYFFMFAALIRETKLGDYLINLKNSFLPLILFLLVSIVVSFLAILKSYTISQGLLYNVFSVFYGIADIAVAIGLFGLIKIAQYYKRGVVYKPLLYVFIGFLLFFVTDMLKLINNKFSFVPDNYCFTMHGITNASFYLIVAYGVFLLGYNKKLIQEKVLKKIEKELLK